MLKQTVQFEDYDGTNKTKVLYFNLTADDVFENADIEQELEDIQREFFEGDDERELTLPEKARLVRIVKRFMKMSYGVQKNVEGDIIFDKSDAVWDHFTKTAVYDTFLFGMFADETGKLMQEFMTGVFPTHVRDQVAKMRAAENGEDPNQPALPISSDNDERPAWLQENREPTPDELRNMSTSEMQLAWKMKADGAFNQ